ncbi:tdcB [Symbiodinium sp. KB8]|nr:tdcB [Symbiodinium sp. KB8]
MAAALARRALCAAGARVVSVPPARLAWRIAACSTEAGYGSTLEFDQPDGHEFESVVDVTLSDISYAHFRNRDAVPTTAVSRNLKLEDQCGGMHVYFKHEYRLPTGSFKERGASFALKRLDEEAKRIGVIAASAGNHAQAMAYHAKQQGIPCTVYMPTIAPLTKIQACRDIGAEVVVQGEHIGEARDAAVKVAAEKGLTYINGYDHPNIIAGAGTMGLEILEQVPDVSAVVVPVGGAGLIAGVAVAIKSMRPDVRIIGVEPENMPSLAAAMAAGHPVDTPLGGATLADGLLVPKVGLNAYHLACKYVDEMVTVREKYIALAMLRLVEAEKCIVEGGGATGLAAALQGRLTTQLAESGASVKDLFHERAWLDHDFSSVHIVCVAETRGAQHTSEMFDALARSGIKVHRISKVHRPLEALNMQPVSPPADAEEPAL